MPMAADQVVLSASVARQLKVRERLAWLVVLRRVPARAAPAAVAVAFPSLGPIRLRRRGIRRRLSSIAAVLHRMCL